MDKLKNRRRSGSLTLPNGAEIAAGETVEIAAAEWVKLSAHVVVAAWLASGDLEHAAAAPAKPGAAGKPAPAKGAATKAGTPPPDPGSTPEVDPLA